MSNAAKDHRYNLRSNHGDEEKPRKLLQSTNLPSPYFPMTILTMRLTHPGSLKNSKVRELSPKLSVDPWLLLPRKASSSLLQSMCRRPPTQIDLSASHTPLLTLTARGFALLPSSHSSLSSISSPSSTKLHGNSAHPNHGSRGIAQYS